MSQKEVPLIEEYGIKGAELRRSFFQKSAPYLREVAKVIASSLSKGGKVLLCGNGGSAADAQHMAGELVGRFNMERDPLPAIALTTDTSILTAVANDYSFEEVFGRQVKALGKKGDVLVAFSTSGRSKNVLHALEVARDKGLITVGITGKGGGDMVHKCDYILCVPSESTPLIQEVHITIVHLLCQLVEVFLFGDRQE